MPYHPLSDPGAIPPTIYSRYAPPPPPSEPLGGHHKADVVIVGGGFTGTSAALHLAEAGASVVLIEANEIGWGASGRNFGQVVPYLRHEAPHALRHFGAERGERLVAAAAGAPDLVFGLIERHGIDCNASRPGLIFAAHTTAAMAGLESRIAFWAQRGVTLRLCDASETRELIGGGRYPGAVVDQRGGTINPLAYVRGLASAAIKAGARIHTRSRVTAMVQEGGGWRVESEAGSVSAGTVILASNAYTDGLWKGLQRSIVPVRVHQLVSKPLGDNQRGSILRGGHAVTDTRRMPSGVRIHHDGRLHLSTGGPQFSAAERADERMPTARIRALFPELGAIEWEHSWSGWIAMTQDEYPRLHELAPGVLAALGYSGRGIGLATVLGRDLARMVGGAGHDTLALPVTAPRAVGIPGVNQLVIKAVMAGKQMRDAIDRLRP